VVREDILPEALQKTVRAKELLAQGGAKTVHEAVERVELSRSAFYKYKDGIHPLSELRRERLITLSLDLEHVPGMLSRVLALIAAHEASVLTLQQSIPLQGLANVVVTADISRLVREPEEMLTAIRGLEGVRRSAVVGRG
jgi:chorismate mutase